MNFTPGQSVIWLNRTLGTDGSDIIDGRNVTIREVQVVQVNAKKVTVRVSSGMGSWIVHVPPENLRPINDPTVVRALNDRKRRGK